MNVPRILATLAIIALGTWAYSTSFRGVFVWDDILSVAENPRLKHVWPPDWLSLPPDLSLSGRPVVSFTFALNYALAPPEVRDIIKPNDPAGPPDGAVRFYRNIWGYHAVNLGIHVLAALVLFGIVRRTLLSERLRHRFGEAASGLALIISVVWLVHPLQTQAVSYIVQRLESLMGLFLLLTLYCAIRAGEEGPRRWWWLGGSIAACALGMGSKEVMVAAPLVVWLWDWSFCSPHVMKRRWPTYVGLLATYAILIALVAQQSRPGSVGFGLGGWTAFSYLTTQAGVVVHYLRLALMPTALVFDYDWPQAASVAEVWPQVALLSALVAMTLFALYRRQPVGFLGAWFFVILAPTSSFLPIPTEVAAEHRMYLPLGSIVTLIVLTGFVVIQRMLRNQRNASKWGYSGGVLLAGVVVIALSTQTHARNRVYWGNESLMEDIIKKRPSNVRALVTYGQELMIAGRHSDAEEYLEKALEFRGSTELMAHAHMYLGSALCAQGRQGEGTPHLSKALALDPTLTDAAALLGEVRLGEGKTAEAARLFDVAIKGTPENPVLLRRVAFFLATVSDDSVRAGTKAVEYAERACRVTRGHDAMSLEALAAAYAEIDRFDDAVRTLRQALELAQAQRAEAFVTVLREELQLLQARRKLRMPVGR